MTHNELSKIESFDYGRFESETLSALRDGKPLTGKDGVLSLTQ